MKKVNKTFPAPPLLDNYKNTNPHDDWEQFRNNGGDGYKSVKKQLIQDQRELCAYCEIDLRQYGGQGLDDFRVEHFFPKSPHTPPPNHALDWQNMLGVCTGGNSRGIGDAQRFTKPDYSCDEPKGDENWVGVILDPQRDIPAFPPIFEFDEQGRMAVSQQCPLHLQGAARSSIEKLRLSPPPSKDIPNPRLIRFRKTVIEMLSTQLGELLGQGLNAAQAASQLAEIYFPANHDSPWPAFFSCIRWYLGPAAEARLQAIDYQG